MQPANIDSGDPPIRSASGISLGNRASQAGAAGQSATSLAPPSVSGTATYGGNAYGSTGNDVGYIAVVPHIVMPTHADAGWAGPVMPDERVREPRRLSTEERLRLRSDIRDASRNMYEHPRGR